MKDHSLTTSLKISRTSCMESTFLVRPVFARWTRPRSGCRRPSQVSSFNEISGKFKVYFLFSVFLRWKPTERGDGPAKRRVLLIIVLGRAEKGLIMLCYPAAAATQSIHVASISVACLGIEEIAVTTLFVRAAERERSSWSTHNTSECLPGFPPRRPTLAVPTPTILRPPRRTGRSPRHRHPICAVKHLRSSFLS